jgi:GTP pyrophosphokinase
MFLTDKFEDALVYATQLHARQTRKGSGVPYISHLLAVASLVLEHGGDEDEVIAALLHDAVEDQGGLKTLEEIRRRYGGRVAAIVEGCSDSHTIPKPPWKKRKVAYLAHLEEADPSVRLVSSADKLHNARAILSDLRRDGAGVWKQFNGGKEGTLWYYRELVRIFLSFGPHPIRDELQRVVAEILRRADADQA